VSHNQLGVPRASWPARTKLHAPIKYVTARLKSHSASPATKSAPSSAPS